MIKFEAITSKEYLEIFYSFHTTLFEKCFIGITQKGICHLSFTDHGEFSCIESLKDEWPQARLKEDTEKTETIVLSIFEKGDDSFEKPLLVKGTDFQTQVWQALTLIPKGTTTNYENIAHMIDKPRAVRATANAIANNPIAYLIPCHRVIRKSGKINKYRWGIERKQAILAYEAELLPYTNS